MWPEPGVRDTNNGVYVTYPKPYCQGGCRGQGSGLDSGERAREGGNAPKPGTGVPQCPLPGESAAPSEKKVEEGVAAERSRCPELRLRAFPVCPVLFQFQSSHVLTIMSSFVKVL